MCFFLYIASPLTLSEVRSMLPPGLTADLLPPVEQAALRPLHPDAQTAARVLHGGCSCDLVTQRHAVASEDETRLRARYRSMDYSRDQVIRALDVHRRALERRAQPAGHWPRAFAAFVTEHARNAGPTLYYLHFSHDGLLRAAGGAPRRVLTPARRPLARGSRRILPCWSFETTPLLRLHRNPPLAGGRDPPPRSLHAPPAVRPRRAVVLARGLLVLHLPAAPDRPRVCGAPGPDDAGCQHPSVAAGRERRE
jgi:hypothetical protein